MSNLQTAWAFAAVMGALAAHACAASPANPASVAEPVSLPTTDIACSAPPVLPVLSSRVTGLLAEMTLDEKLGQLNQARGGRSKSLNSELTPAELDKVRRGEIGSYLHVAGAAELGALQKVAVEESRLGIPLLFAMDVVHGYKTIFPVPIAMASTWDPDDWQSAARIAADEASSSGLHWTFAPMVDIARDPRWGRIVEGAGSDPYLGARMAVAQVHGYQGGDLSDPHTLLATTKHFGVYGAATGGRDYGSADVSEQSLMETYMPPFYAASQAGSGSMMTAFNDIGGVPSTANEDLVDGLLRGTWGFDGMIVSDWNAVLELMNHGVAATRTEAGALALRAGVDMDMTSGVMPGDLRDAVQADGCLMRDLDGAVARILTTKEHLGLFDTPMAYHDPAREVATLLTPASRAEARRIAARTMVLLKNDNSALPLDTSPKTVAVIGALAEDRMTQLGSWRARGDQDDVVSLLDGLRAAAPDGTTITYAAGSHPSDSNAGGIAAATSIAAAADRILLVIGEDYDLSGEARSRSDLSLPESQRALADAIFATGKPVTIILVTGRPLVLDTIANRADTILNTWMLGVEAGNALANIVWGKVSPAGRLPADFPRRTGAVPYTYSEYPGGRPAEPDLTKDSNRYRDSLIGALYPFGYGLSYTTFDYGDLQAADAEIAPDGTISLSVKVTNTGARDSDEVVQLYMRDPIATLARPKLELRGFKRLPLAAGESRTVTFSLSPAESAIWHHDAGWIIEAGQLDFMVGASSADIRSTASVTITASAPASAPAAALETRVDIQ